MAFNFQTGLLGLKDIATNHSSQGDHALGTIACAQDPDYFAGEFIFLKGVASTAVGEWVLYAPDDFSTSLLAANDIGHVAVAMSACVASEFGWYQIQGKGVALVAASFADNGNLYSTATAGTADDAIVAGDRIQGAKGASAIGTPAAGQAEVEIHRPFVNNALAD